MMASPQTVAAMLALQTKAVSLTDKLRRGECFSAEDPLDGIINKLQALSMGSATTIEDVEAVVVEMCLIENMTPPPILRKPWAN